MKTELGAKGWRVSGWKVPLDEHGENAWDNATDYAYVVATRGEALERAKGLSKITSTGSASIERVFCRYEDQYDEEDGILTWGEDFEECERVEYSSECPGEVAFNFPVRGPMNPEEWAAQ